MSKSDAGQRQENYLGEGQPNRPHIKTYDRWQLFFLDRLHRLSLLNKEAEQGHLSELQVSLLRRAIFSTLLDCDAVGVGEEARQLMSLRT